MIKLDSRLLKNVCEVVDFSKPKINLKIAQELFKLMIKENGIGLAANQAGINTRVFVMSVNNKAYHCFNPTIVENRSELVTYNEGCLSFPNERCEIVRPDKILVKYYNAFGVETIEWLDGLASRCFQHELDHLNGLTMHDRITPR
jgi:peptide deformylase